MNGGELTDAGKQGLDQFGSGLGEIGANGLNEPLLTIFITGRTGGFKEAVGVEENTITGMDEALMCGVIGVGEEAEGRAGTTVRQERGDVVGGALEEERMRVAGVGVAELAAFKVGDEIERGGEDGGLGLLKDVDEFGVDLGEEEAGIGGLGGEFVDERTDHGRDKGGADAVAHDVADEHPGHRVRDGKNMKEIAGKVGGRLVVVVEAEPGLFGG